jgi:hypothetical protein
MRVCVTRVKRFLLKVAEIKTATKTDLNSARHFISITVTTFSSNHLSLQQQPSVDSQQREPPVDGDGQQSSSVLPVSTSSLIGFAPPTSPRDPLDEVRLYL